MPVSPMIEITYCRLCGWALRAGWMAQELLTTFAEELGSVTDNAVMFLAYAGQEPRDIHKRDDGNVEAVAKAYKACALIR